MNTSFIVSLDQGTTSSRALLIDHQGKIIGMEQEEFEQLYPQSGWVEHDPAIILQSQLRVFEKLIKNTKVTPDQIAAIGITNQRETTVVWDSETGKPIYNAIVWQDKRTAPFCEKLKKRGLTDYVRKNTGLVIDSYFSGTKIKWILDNVEGAQEKADRGMLRFGTIDSWLIWNLTKENVHVTDYSNASRSLLFNINTLEWDKKLLSELEIPASMLPKVLPSSSIFGMYELNGVKIPIASVLGDQQAALFGQACLKKGNAKNTYGTGCFLLMNTGKKPQFSKNGLITTIAWGVNGKVRYALEGSIFIAGAAVQWLRDELNVIESACESEKLALSLDAENPVYVVPAFAGLGAPYWDMYARGAIFGLTRDTGKAHIAKATLDSLGYQVKDILQAMQSDSGIKLKCLKVDGGAAANNYLMQFQADILNKNVIRPKSIESTALGAAYMAGITIGMWSEDDILKSRTVDKIFEPNVSKQLRNKMYAGWKKAVKRTMNWECD
ncbi:glycerol kinase GlpK [Cellulophaga baltica]|uniref:glycerol kinase GlpK n=1 Tax=Cellulophaga baltica TaxID=76594 RepID=UPI0015F36D35|nr:glycerol kinase GlpK [Cellulophaga baltica]MBA6314157.1 glycerol kinase GlpK [Cellulophaga baltica]MCR1026783.1 glycerol kinase GlpK [Cellulophaga baltica]